MSHKEQTPRKHNQQERTHTHMNLSISMCNINRDRRTTFFSCSEVETEYRQLYVTCVICDLFLLFSGPTVNSKTTAKYQFVAVANRAW